MRKMCFTANLPSRTGTPARIFSPLHSLYMRTHENSSAANSLPVYMNPLLQKRISPELKKHIQGKAWFNFSEVDPELAELTHAGFDGYRAMKFV
jgi:hypothetical protein